jgi:hypothetical protein
MVFIEFKFIWFLLLPFHEFVCTLPSSTEILKTSLPNAKRELAPALGVRTTVAPKNRAAGIRLNQSGHLHMEHSPVVTGN